LSNKEWLLSEEFSDYREAEIEAGYDIIKGILHNDVKPDYLKGAMDMLRAIVRLPETKAGSDEEKEIAKTLRIQATKAIEMKILREALNVDE